MIRAHQRLKGGPARLGATGPGRAGPFGRCPVDDDQDDEDQNHEPADRAGKTRST